MHIVQFLEELSIFNFENQSSFSKKNFELITHISLILGNSLHQKMTEYSSKKKFLYSDKTNFLNLSFGLGNFENGK